MPLLDTIIHQIGSSFSPSVTTTVAGLKGSSPAFIVSRIMEASRRPLVIVATDQDAAEEIHREITFYCACGDIVYFPSWDMGLLEPASPHPQVTGQRLQTLFKLMEGTVKGVVTTVAALRQRVISRRLLGGFSHLLMTGEETDREKLLESLVKLGYGNVPLVEDKGTFSVRGGILDIFPPDREAPVRVEFFGDFVESIRTFDPISQRSLLPQAELVLLPSREVILSEQVVSAAAPRLKKLCDDLDIPAGRRREMLEQLQHAMYPTGIENLLPLFHPGLETLYDYTGPDAVTVLIDPEALRASSESFDADLAAAERKSVERDQIVSPTGELYLNKNELDDIFLRHPRIAVAGLELAGETGPRFELRVETNEDIRVEHTSEATEVLKPLTDRLTGWLAEGRRIIIACHQRGQVQRLHDLLTPYGVPLVVSDRPFEAELRHLDGRIGVLIGEISRGFRLPEEKLVVVAEEEIFGRRVRRRGLSEVRKKQILTSLSELKPGDYIVHLDHGVGIYRGLQHLKFTGVEGDFLLLEYAGNDKLYLPVDRIGLVQRYVGAEGLEPRVDKLGGTAWEKTKGKALAAIEEMAEELLKIYAARQVEQAYAFSPPDDMYREFEASFAFEETPDQLAAIEDVLRDMGSTKPMDRLVCGDVGYGKTEVALRGAFKAVLDGKQVAILVPTTVLAQQHMETFRSRLAGYPVTVEMLSRFRSPKEQKETLAKLKKGDVDIIIGTHRLLQNDVAFKDLGLLIVDEEQRFGVTHKEKMKKYRAVVDIMTLTATPIPRTLYMSLMGIRDLSIIDTPPVDRLAVKTYVARFNDEVIREAVMRELRRGGQVFFVHNRVQSIGAMAEHLQRIVPEAKICIGHGQMNEHELEEVMLSFMHGECNLLLCTTIIESGLDIPNANTLIVNRADNLGLAQLYQLRGRVGRAKQRAHAYFLLPGEGAISSDARERLKILQDLSELGAGFRIASHDLELRGAGDLLGARQSGNIVAVGFELYTELLDEAIRKLSGTDVSVRIEPEIKLRIPAFIPEEYVPDPNQRLVIYKKLTQADNEDEVADMSSELIDRFGALPPAALYLIEVMKLRIHLKALLVTEIDYDGRRLTLAFHQKTPVSPDTIIGLIRRSPKRYQFTPDFRLVVEHPEDTFDGLLKETRKILQALVSP